MSKPFRRSYTDSKTGKKRKTKCYYGRIKNRFGKWERVKLCRDKTAAQSLLNEKQAKADRERAGQFDPYEDHRNTPLVCRECNSTGKRTKDGKPCECRDGAHLSDFRRHMEAKGNDDRHISETATRVRKVVDGCRFHLISDLSAEAVAGWLRDQREAVESLPAPPDSRPNGKKKASRGVAGHRH